MKGLACVRVMMLLSMVLASTLTAAGAPADPPVLVQTVYDVGLEGASAMALSPDEQFLYIASSADSAVTVFQRDAATGQLSFVEVIRDGERGADALMSAGGIVVSAEGGQVYVTSWREDALTVFNRDAMTGRLTYVETHREGVGGIMTLDGAHGVVASADNRHVYVASYVDGAVSGFTRDPATGRLSFGGAFAGLSAPYGLALSPDGRHLYVPNYDNDTLTIFARNAATGALSFLGAVQDGVGSIDGLDGALHATVSNDGASVYVASAAEDAVAIFHRDPATGGITYRGAQIDGVAGVDGLDGVGMVTVSHNGAHLYAAGNNDQSLAIFARNPSNSALTFVGKVTNGYEGVGEMQSPYWITLDATDSHLYVAAWSYGAVEVFQRNAANGALTIVEEALSGDGLEGAVGVAAGAAGCVYVTGYDDSALAYFSRDLATGVLTYEGAVDSRDLDGLAGAVGVGVSPDGKHIYVAGHDASAVVAFERWSCSAMEIVATYNDVLPSSSLAGTRAVAFSPDGSLVYVVSDVDDAVTVFNRNADSGELTFRQAVRDTDTGIDGLDGAYAVAASPDGTNFYVTGYEDDTVAAFRWAGGFLSYVGVVKDGVGGANGLDGANSVVVSPDGGYVYVAGRRDDAVVILRRDFATGALSYLGMVQDGAAGVDGLDGARALAITPDGSQLYVASQLDDALAIFNRSVEDGGLSYLTAYVDGVDGVDGLDTADGIAVSPDGGHLYVASYDDDAVTVFARFRAYFPLTLR